MNKPQFTKTKVFTLLIGFILLPGCNASRAFEAAHGSKSASTQFNDRFHGTGGAGQLILDAVNRKEGVTFYNEHGSVISAPGSLSPRNTSQSAYPGGERGVPKTIRATWRTGYFEQKAGGGGWDGGTIIADYTIPVADRIPDEVLDDIRRNGGALRIKLRLKDDGILLGWDVMRRKPKPGVDYSHCKKHECVYGLHYETPGGDFLDTRY
jgi:hypothetical protein